MSDQLQKDDIQTSLKNLGFEDLLPPASQKNQALYTSNFEEERPVLLTLWSMLEQGATNPYVNSAARTTRYGRFIESGSPDLIEQVQSEGGRVLPLDSGEVLVVRKENTISLALVNKFYEVVNRLNQGYQPVPKEAELKKHLNDGLLPLIAGLPADSSQMTAEDYVAFADSVFKFVQGTENPYVMNLVQQLMMPELGPYLLVFQQVTSQIEAGLANGEDVSELQDQLNQIMGQVNSMGLAAFFKQVEPSLQQALGMPDFKTRLPDQKLTAESITQQMDQTVAFVVEMARLAKLDFESNFDEYVAQATLLRSVLVFDSGLSEYVGQILELVALNNNSDLALERMKNLDPAAYQGLLSPEAYVNQVVNTPEFSKLRMQAVQRNLSAQRR